MVNCFEFAPGSLLFLKAMKSFKSPTKKCLDHRRKSARVSWQAIDNSAGLYDFLQYDWLRKKQKLTEFGLGNWVH